MSGLLYLTDEDFNIQKGQKGDLLCTDISGFSLVLFYSLQCEYCKELKPIFNSLAKSIGGIYFGMLNVSKYMNVVKMSEHTLTRIEYVPYLVLYINSKPLMRYDGPYDEEEIAKFVIDVTTRIQKNQSMPTEQMKEKEKEIPAYCSGQPLCGSLKKRVCYLDSMSAYENNDKKYAKEFNHLTYKTAYNK